MQLLDWLFGHAYAYVVVAVFFAAAIADIAFFHCWLLPRARKLGAEGSPEGQKALAGLGVPLYLGAACCIAIAVTGLVYHSSL